MRQSGCGRERCVPASRDGMQPHSRIPLSGLRWRSPWAPETDTKELEDQAACRFDSGARATPDRPRRRTCSNTSLLEVPLHLGEGATQGHRVRRETRQKPVARPRHQRMETRRGDLEQRATGSSSMVIPGASPRPCTTAEKPLRPSGHRRVGAPRSCDSSHPGRVPGSLSHRIRRSSRSITTVSGRTEGTQLTLRPRLLLDREEIRRPLLPSSRWISEASGPPRSARELVRASASLAFCAFSDPVAEMLRPRESGARLLSICRRALRRLVESRPLLRARSVPSPSSRRRQVRTQRARLTHDLLSNRHILGKEVAHAENTMR